MSSIIIVISIKDVAVVMTLMEGNQ